MPNDSNVSGQRGYYISATKKSSGKTVVSLGLGAALSQSGYSVQPYKKGPDYIDPLWHQAATGRPCFNLDFFTQTREEIRQTFDRNRQGADLVYIEGNKGLFDGLDTQGSDCNAALAELVELPVVLVVNAQGITRGIAPLLSGYEHFSDSIEYAGIVLNEVAGPRHEAKLLAAVQEYTDLTVLGVLPKLAKLHLEERHLGLVPQNEARYSETYIKQAAALVNEHVDVSLLLERSSVLPASDYDFPAVELPHTGAGLRIGVARDAAFGFYYPDDLQALRSHGATLVFVDTLVDQQLPEVDALFIGGGFPETQLDALEGNKVMREQIAAFIRSGNPVYAECGGLMYLCRNISYKDKKADMVGVIDADVIMTDKPIGRGYARIKARPNHLWGDRLDESGERNCHEFHYSRLEGTAGQSDMAYDVSRGFGVNGSADGIMIENTLAAYCHQRHTENNPWVTQFINFIHSKKHENH